MRLKKRGLAGPVGADQRGDGAPLDLEVLDVDGHEAAEGAAHAVDHEDRVGLGPAGPRATSASGAGGGGRGSTGIEHHLVLVAEHPLWSEDHQQHQPEADQARHGTRRRRSGHEQVGSKPSAGRLAEERLTC
jgi:hypothetical protein